jgi:hypothetical protein
MDEQNKLDTSIGTAESETKLTPKPVRVIEVSTEPVTYGEKQWDAVLVHVLHPDKEEAIILKKVKFEKEGKLKTVGLSLSLDKDSLLNKNSALAFLLKFYKVTKPSELKGKELQTSVDDKGYLCFKAY